MSEERSAELLLEATRKAAEAAAETEAELDLRRGDPPRPGNLYVFSATAEQGLEWLVAERGDDGRLLLLPADTHPLAGSVDVEIPEDAPAGPLTLRCGHPVWLEERAFAGAERTGEVTAEVLLQARDKQHRAEAGTLRGGPLERETDEDPELQDWLEEVQEAVRNLRVLSPRSREREPRRRAVLPWSVAASLAVLSLGLGAWSLVLKDRVKELSGPLVIGNMGQIRVGDGSRGVVSLPWPPEGANLLVSLVLPDDLPHHERFKLEIESPETGRLWAFPIERPSAVLNVVLRRRDLRPGSPLRVRLFGETGGRRELLEETAVRLAVE